jgi:hypothetical protein
MQLGPEDASRFFLRILLVGYAFTPAFNLLII